MKAIFTSQYWIDVDSIEEAAEICHKADHLNIQTIKANFQEQGISMEDAAEIMSYLGTSFWILEPQSIDVEMEEGEGAST